MSLRRLQPAHDDPAATAPQPLAYAQGVYACRCPDCGRDFLATDASRCLIRVDAVHAIVACPDCWTPQHATAAKTRLEGITGRAARRVADYYKTQEGAA